MKQGLNFIMDVYVDYDIINAQHIDFIFVQGTARKLFHYPSQLVTIDTVKNIAHITWSSSDTYLFNTANPIKMDTRIKIKNSTINPQTSIVTFKMEPTLFKQSQIQTDSVYAQEE